MTPTVPTPALFDMSDHVAVITGAGRGIGSGIAEIVAAGGRAIAVTTDVTDDDALERLAQTAVDEFGKLTTWVNNAGGSHYRAQSDVGGRWISNCGPDRRHPIRPPVDRSNPWNLTGSNG